MTTRITKSLDPILAALRAEYLDALDAARFADNTEQWDAAIDRVNAARTAFNKRFEIYLPKRERKASRKKGWGKRLFARLAKGPEPRHPLSTMYFAREMRCVRNYLDTLQNRNVHPQMRDEFINETKTCLFWARHHRIQAAELGRHLP